MSGEESFRGWIAQALDKTPNLVQALALAMPELALFLSRSLPAQFDSVIFIVLPKPLAYGISQNFVKIHSYLQSEYRHAFASGSVQIS
jgi:hypothetical protein